MSPLLLFLEEREKRKQFRPQTQPGGRKEKSGDEGRSKPAAHTDSNQKVSERGQKQSKKATGVGVDILFRVDTEVNSGGTPQVWRSSRSGRSILKLRCENVSSKSEVAPIRRSATGGLLQDSTPGQAFRLFGCLLYRRDFFSAPEDCCSG